MVLRMLCASAVASLLTYLLLVSPGGRWLARAASEAGVGILRAHRGPADGGNSPHSLLSKAMGLLDGAKYQMVGQAECVYQLPPPGSPRKGLLLLLHGCNHGAIDFWPKSVGCPTCIGLPEELNITLHSLLRGYGVVAVSSAARDSHRCWQVAGVGRRRAAAQRRKALAGYSNQDVANVRSVLDHVVRSEGLAGLPLYAMGASSGGAFALSLPAEMPGVFAGICSQIMALPRDMLQEAVQVAKQHGEHTDEEADERGGTSSSHSAPAYPPTLLVHMVRDRRTASGVDDNVAVFRAEGVVTEVIPVHPAPLTPLYLVQRCAPEISEAQSRAIYQALKAAGYLAGDGRLLHNPRGQPSWQGILEGAKIPGFQTLRLQNPDESPISEELNLLFAGHEITSETTDAMLSFFEQHTVLHHHNSAEQKLPA